MEESPKTGKGEPAIEFDRESYTEGDFIVTAGGKRLRRWGSVQQACNVLDGCNKQTIYDLRDSGEIAAYKLNPAKKNSHLKVDLLSVWKVKQKQLRARSR